MTDTRTPDDFQALVEAARVPDGYRITVKPQRRFANRSLWAVRVHRDGKRVFGRAFYNVAAGIVVAQAWAWADSRGRA